MDELIQLVVRRTGVAPAVAVLAVMAVLDYLTARLPSPVVGRIREQLGAVSPSPSRPADEAGA